ncbi:MAG: protein translocase subunit SecF [Desulfarculaceae bacterium]|nr:protein translocase subunit SecF [Desulfarculaceae bacterium]MCF8046337.1 protein translocase subunit SecF [Desulfarculaceae bacterium]MCF8063707.1 protein translocase subunit SecF [Desulfarculaceae bacterium]MCF8098339.1 protein translocase subunit SecF [Desulfarculaceae bacterium]MCF8121595.1 protein translocase subunit SecF [Desulfarculaceae bacterium]
MEFIKPNIDLNFVGNRGKAFIISGLLILMTIASLFIHGGPNYGIDFAGGILVQVRFAEPTDATDIKKALAPLGMEQSMVQGFGEKKNNEFLIRNEKKDLNLQGLSDRVRQTLAKTYGQGKVEVRRVEMVGPKVGKDLREKALLAIFYAIILIAVYISGRFEQKWGLAALMAGVLVGATLLVQALIVAMGGDEGIAMVLLILTALVVTVGACWLLKLRYALGAIVALIHDVVITVGVFSLLDKEFTLATVAALLTIIGYSLNDTIIVYDRIRENLKRAGKQSLDVTINASINQTLSRTILTSGTTLIVLLCLFVLGGGVIEDFALALLVGVVVGTYSSVFVASPVLLLLPEGRPMALRRSAPAKAAPVRPEPMEAQPVPAQVSSGKAAGAARQKRSKKKSRRKGKRR